MFLRKKIKSPFIKLKSETPYLSPEGRDLVVILGTTGSGQSTFANYMAGVQMEMKSNDKLVLKPGQQNICKTKYSPGSVTAFPQVVSTDKGIDLLDCRALDAEFESPKNEVSTFATQHAILQAKSIQGIVVVIDYYNIKNLHLTWLTDRLEQTISNFYQQKDSIIFVVNHAPKNVTLDDVLQKLKERADHEIKDEPNRTSKQTFYHLIKDNPEKIHFFNPTDENKRELIATQMKALKPLPKESFNFPGFVKARLKVYQGIELLTENLAELVKLKMELTNEKFAPHITQAEKDNIDTELGKLELLINECSELIELKSLFITMMTKTDSATADQYKTAYHKYIERETHTLDFDDARAEIIADRVGFLMDKSLDMIKDLMAFVLAQSKDSDATQTHETPVAQDQNDAAEEKRSFSPR